MYCTTGTYIGRRAASALYSAYEIGLDKLKRGKSKKPKITLTISQAYNMSGICTFTTRQL